MWIYLRWKLLIVMSTLPISKGGILRHLRELDMMTLWEAKCFVFYVKSLEALDLMKPWKTNSIPKLLDSLGI
mgnify:CR=1 FL=1